MDNKKVYNSYKELGFDDGFARLMTRRCELHIEVLKAKNSMVLRQLYELTNDNTYYVPGTYEEHKKSFEEKRLIAAGLTEAVRVLANGKPVKKSEAECEQYEELQNFYCDLCEKLDALNK